MLCSIFQYIADAIFKSYSLTQPSLYNIIFSLWLRLRTSIPPSVSPSSTVCASVSPSLGAFTNSWYTLPFPFLLFRWQKLHWWKLTCKVDSFVCLIQSLISLPTLHSLVCIYTTSLPSTFFSQSLPPQFPWTRWLRNFTFTHLPYGIGNSPIGIQVLPSCICGYGLMFCFSCTCTCDVLIDSVWCFLSSVDNFYMWETIMHAFQLLSCLDHFYVLHQLNHCISTVFSNAIFIVSFLPHYKHIFKQYFSALEVKKFAEKSIRPLACCGSDAFN